MRKIEDPNDQKQDISPHWTILHNKTRLLIIEEEFNLPGGYQYLIFATIF